MHECLIVLILEWLAQSKKLKQSSNHTIKQSNIKKDEIHTTYLASGKCP